MLTWCVSLSSSAPVKRSDPKVSVHSSNGRLLVISVAPRSYRCETNSNSNSAPVLLSGTKPSSSMISSLWLTSCFCRRHSRRSSRASINPWTKAAGVVKPTAEPLLTGGQPQAQRDMGFARATRPEGDDVSPPLDPFAAGQLQHLHLVEAGDRLEVEAVETFDRGELGGLDPALDHPPLAIDQLQFHQPGKELDMVHPLS